MLTKGTPKPNYIARYWQSASRRKKMLTVLISIVVVPLLVFTAMRGLQIFNKNEQAKSRVTKARMSIEGRADNDFGLMVDAVLASGLTVSEIGASKYDVCYVSEDDHGWLAYNFYQKCYLRYVRGYTTHASKDQVRQLVRTSQGLFGDTNDIEDDRQVFPCRFAVSDHEESLRYITNKTQNADRRDCGAPGSVEGLLSIENPTFGLVVKKISGNPVPAANGTIAQSQIWIMTDVEYYREDLGCGVSLIFCDNPRPQAVLPGSHKPNRYSEF